MSAASTPSGPQPIISNREEDTLRKQAKAKALSECRAQMEAFAQCTQTRTISMLWACRDLRNDLSKCLLVYTSEEAFEKDKQAYLQQSRPDARSI
ncbi:uncharacterized protein PAN0_020d5944 [Moesziomyces antarcticus]|uniref:Related to CMC1 - mitochondrial intermembrane space copper-binding protein n=2 Tax=Pseudozyma antarctica TaxID=84753 RepID=A0A5C3FXM4_PSEA2|nr:uncharacterized protein PAN0_020d5944 [Moesziomyces antarcticus]GAK67715.1 conserved hypothetical protein [Moesziomyces antarcticus]SPO49052.1 related to CMC1 - mitochondrial intermembrane space copper-binding protein [Moesziomyces antarcticus]